MKKINLNKITTWYRLNLEKLVFMLLVIVLFTLTVAYIPFLNVFISHGLGFMICMIVWYILFSPGTKVLVFISLITVFIEIVLTFFAIAVFIDVASELLYVFVVFIFMNYMREEVKIVKSRVK